MGVAAGTRSTDWHSQTRCELVGVGLGPFQPPPERDYLGVLIVEATQIVVTGTVRHEWTSVGLLQPPGRS
jgi:hypothetical protein